MISARKLAANRRNALKSTGPRTPAGKKTCSMNALKHGLCSAELFLPEDVGPAFEDLQSHLFRELAPRDGEQRALVERIAGFCWRIRIAGMIERDAFEECALDGSRESVNFLMRLHRYASESRDQMRKALRELRYRKNSRRGSVEPEESNGSEHENPETGPISAVTRAPA